MLSEYEAQKLKYDMKQELDATSSAVYKCAAWLLVVVALALIGSAIDLQRDVAGNTAPAAKRAAVQHHDRVSIAETRKVLEERRKRFESHPPVQAVRSSEAAEIDRAQGPEIDELTLITRSSD